MQPVEPGEALRAITVRGRIKHRPREAGITPETTEPNWQSSSKPHQIERRSLRAGRPRSAEEGADGHFPGSTFLGHVHITRPLKEPPFGDLGVPWHRILRPIVRKNPNIMAQPQQPGYLPNDESL